MARPSDTAYVYASSRVKSADGVGTEATRLSRLIECNTVRDVYDAVIDSSICPAFEKRTVTSDSDAVAAVSEALEGALDYAAGLVRESVPDVSLYDLLFYKYDCNNIKAAVKSALRGVPTEGTVFSCGTLSPECVNECANSRNASALPANMARALTEAFEVYERTGEARSIDFILDRACFADMAECAERSGVPMFKEYVRALADVTNVRTAVRISSSRLAPAAAEALMARVFIPCGSVPESAFIAEGGGVCDLAGLAASLPLTDLKGFVSDAAEDAEKADTILEKYIFRTVGDFAGSAFGPEVPARFFIYREREIRRYRKALSLLSMGIAKKDILKERLGVL